MTLFFRYKTFDWPLYQPPLLILACSSCNMKRIGILLFFLLFHGYIFSQNQSDTLKQKKNSLLQSRTTQKLIGTIKRTPPPDSAINIKSETPFLPYEGKIIRK